MNQLSGRLWITFEANGSNITVFVPFNVIPKFEMEPISLVRFPRLKVKATIPIQIKDTLCTITLRE